jgi:Diadenosine tetraphosphate (Ap4A) hydrolase and other HIT family hydrolases
VSWLERLWSPWRFEYIKSSNEEKKVCFICKAANNPEDPESLVIYVDNYILILLNRYPYNNGHLMIAPKSHKKNFEELTKEEWNNLIEALLLSKKVLDNLYKPQGYNIGINLGRVAGAGLEDHLHIHVVPRWAGDTNFMTTISATKVMAQTLKDSWEAMRKEIKNIISAYKI